MHNASASGTPSSEHLPVNRMAPGPLLLLSALWVASFSGPESSGPLSGTPSILRIAQESALVHRGFDFRHRLHDSQEKPAVGALVQWGDGGFQGLGAVSS